MIKNYLRIAQNIPVAALVLELHRHPELWNRNMARLSRGGPHHETDDIWLRYKDEAENKNSNDYSNFGDEHDPVWYPAYYALPAARALIFDLMAAVEGERLGGVLLYRVPPGKRIYPHSDKGWHAEYYDKFNIYLKADEDTAFKYENGEAIRAVTGDVYHFVNTIQHEVINESEEEQLVLTVCIRLDPGAGLCRQR